MPNEATGSFNAEKLANFIAQITVRYVRKFKRKVR